MSNFRNTLTKEQKQIYDANYRLAKEHFNLQSGYILHHTDETLRHNDIERYIQWLPEDLQVMSKAEHCILHHTGFHHTDETKKRLSEANKISCNTEEYIQSIKDRQIGTHWYNNGTVEVQTFYCPDGYVKGRITKNPMSEEQKAKISATMKGRTNHPQTEETRKKISEARKLYWQNKKSSLQIK